MKKFLAFVAVALAGVASMASVALADYGTIGTFSGPGAGDGELNQPGRAAIQASTGKLLVVDAGNNRVQLFAPTATGAAYESQFGSGIVTNPFGIAIDQSTGAVYVSDADEIVKFDVSLAVDATFARPAVTGPLAVDPVSHDLLVADAASNTIKRYNADGTPDGSFNGSAGVNSPGAFTGLLDIAVDSTGDVLVVDSSGDVLSDQSGTSSSVERYSAGGSYEATIGPVDGAGAVAVDPDGDRVIVGGKFHTWSSSQLPHLWTFEADGTPVNDFDLNALYAIPRGIAAVGGGSDRLYVVTKDPYDQPYGPTQGFAFGEVTPPTAAIAAPSNITGASVDLAGTVNPQGGPLPTGYRFELSDNGGVNWVSTPEQDAGAGSADVSVALTRSGLDPRTEYQVRLVARKGSVIRRSSIETFTTGAVVPVAGTNPPTRVGSRSATLAATVDPRKSQTAYWFEYGTDANYGTSSPAAHDADAGDGDAPTVVTRQIQDLQPETTYHFRVVASNVAGTTYGSDRTFTTNAVNAATGLPDGRVYEMVSPPDKGGIDVRQLHGDSRSSVNGDRITFVSYNKFPGTGGVGASTSPRYMASRTADGWQTRSVDPPIGPNPADIGGFTALTGVMHFPQTYSADLEYSAPLSLRIAVTPDAEPDRVSLYRHRFTDNSYELVSKSLVGPLGPGGYGFGSDLPFPRAVTDDAEHIVFESTSRRTPDAPSTGSKLYEWDHGDLRLVSILPNGTPATDPMLGLNASVAMTGTYRGDKALSRDGSRIIFTADQVLGDCCTSIGGKLYMRENGGTPAARTLWLSESEKVVPDPDPKPAWFRDASEDASRVFFTTAEQLVDDDTDASTDLYMYDLHLPEGHRLTRLSHVADTPGGQVANVRGVVGVSDDGSRVYFAAHGSLTPDAEQTQYPVPKLYLWDQGSLRFITTLSSSGDNDTYPGGDGSNWNQDMRADNLARVSPDGRHLMFRSELDLTSAGTGGTAQLYLYDASTGDLRCMSCVRGGMATSDGVTAIFSKPPLNIMGYQPRMMVDTDRGVQAYFNTKSPLVPADVNDKVDVYRYDQATDSVALISSGRSAFDSLLAEASPGGKDAFFLTRERLSKWDKDEAIDLYDARVNGGLPDPPDLVPVCQDDSCQNPPSQRPDLADPASDHAQGAVGEAFPRLRPRATFGRLGSSVRLALRKHGNATIPVTVNGAGTVTITARGQLGGKSQLLGRGSKRATKAQTVKVRLVLTKAARRQISRGAAVRLSLALTFAGKPGQRGASLTLPAVRHATDHTSRKGR
jgi:hypothetical protein